MAGFKGRPKGVVNHLTRQVQAFCRRVCEDPEYQDSIFERARTNTLGAMEPVLWAYAYGKPKERIEVSVAQELGALSDVELLQKADELRDRLLEAAAEASAVPAEFKVENDEQ